LCAHSDQKIAARVVHPQTLCLRLWKDAFLDENLPQSDSVSRIDRQDIDCCSADICATHENGPVPQEVFVPGIIPGIKQPDDFSTLTINAADVGPFVIVACKAGESQVVVSLRAMMLLSDDVIDLKSQLIKLLPHSAILASADSTAHHECPKNRIH
jgi:hypothetical protein